MKQVELSIILASVAMTFSIQLPSNMATATPASVGESLTVAFADATTASAFFAGVPGITITILRVEELVITDASGAQTVYLVPPPPPPPTPKYFECLNAFADPDATYLDSTNDVASGAAVGSVWANQTADCIPTARAIVASQVQEAEVTVATVVLTTITVQATALTVQAISATAASAAATATSTLAATADVATSVGASAAQNTAVARVGKSTSTSVARGGAGAAVGAILGAQRFSMYGKLASGVNLDDDSLSAGSNPILGSFGIGANLFVSEPPDHDAAGVGPAGRRLQQRTSRVNVPRTRRIQNSLSNRMLDHCLSFGLAFCVVLVLHYTIAVLWAVCVNRSYYGSKRKSPARISRNLLQLPQEAPQRFRPLPAALIFPNFELILLSLYATGTMSVCALMLGAFITGVDAPSTLTVALFAVALAMLTLWLLLQTRALMRFHVDHSKLAWKANVEDELQDPLFRMLVRCRLVSAQPRLRGEFVPPPAWKDAEPTRTEHAISLIPMIPWKSATNGRRALTRNKQTSAFRAGQRAEQLSIWLSGASGGSLRGISYRLGQLLLQLGLALSIGLFGVVTMADDPAGSSSTTAVNVTSDERASGDVAARSDGSSSVAGWLLPAQIVAGCFQLALIAWSLCAEPADRLEGFFSAAMASLEFLSTMLLIASVQVTDAELAAALGGATSTLLLTAALLPAALSTYDGLALPIARSIAERRAPPKSQSMLEILIALIAKPFDVLMALFAGRSGGHGSVSDAVKGLGNQVLEAWNGISLKRTFHRFMGSARMMSTRRARTGQRKGHTSNVPRPDEEAAVSASFTETKKASGWEKVGVFIRMINPLHLMHKDTVRNGSMLPPSISLPPPNVLAVRTQSATRQRHAKNDVGKRKVTMLFDSDSSMARNISFAKPNPSTSYAIDQQANHQAWHHVDEIEPSTELVGDLSFDVVESSSEKPPQTTISNVGKTILTMERIASAMEPTVYLPFAMEGEASAMTLPPTEARQQDEMGAPGAPRAAISDVAKKVVTMERVTSAMEPTVYLPFAMENETPAPPPMQGLLESLTFRIKDLFISTSLNHDRQPTEFIFSEPTLGIGLHDEAGGAVIRRVKLGSQAEELGVPIGGKVISVNGRAAFTIRTDLNVQLMSAVRPTALLITPPANDSTMTEQLEGMLRTFDVDRNSIITPDEFHDLVVHIDPKVTLEETQRTYDELLASGFDADDDGQLSVAELTSYWLETFSGASSTNLDPEPDLSA